MIHKLLLCCITVISCNPAAGQTRPLPQRIDPSKKVLEYYRQYPDRYIRISEESWKTDSARGNTSAVTHSFTLKNNATITYAAIEVRFDYQTASGKSLQTKTVVLKEALGPLARKKFNVTVKNVPEKAEKVITAVTKAFVQ